MKISYDTESDALYIELFENKSQIRIVQFSNELALDVINDGRVIGIEILDAKENLGNGSIPTVILQNVNFEIA